MILPKKLGTTPVVGAMLKFSKNPLEFMEWAQTLGEPMVYDKALGQYYFMVFEPSLVEQILIKNAKNYKKNYFLKFWSDYFGEGLLTADGEKWQKDRKIIQPIFSRDKIQVYTQKFDVVCKDNTKDWEVGQKITADREMDKISMDLFLSTVLGVKLSEEEYRQAIHDFENCSNFFRFSADAIGMHVSKLPIPLKFKYKKSIASLHRLIEKIVRNKEAELMAGHENVDLVTTLLRARLDNIRDQLMTFLVAGHETTSLSLSYAIHLLSLHPEKQEKLREELRLARSWENNFEHATYLHSVIVETMRLYPSSWMLGRDAIDDDKIGGFDIPAKSMVIIPTWAFHHNPNWFPNPEEFIPERWTKEFEAQLPKSAYIPFGFGSRMCIGATFAMYEMKFALANIYSKFGTKLLSGSKLELVPSVTARSKHPIEVELT